MARIFGVHGYVLKRGVKEEDLERAFRQAEERGLLSLPGLVERHFLKGVKGKRKGRYASIWVFESREAWEKLWGPPERPLTKKDYPANWKIWEDEILAPLLDRDPDKITFTDYQEL